MKTFAVLCLFSLSFPALAGELPVDVITLTDGTVLRGHATELKPGDHVELVLLDGRIQSIPWSQMVSSVGPSFPCDPAAPFLAPSPGRVALQVDSPVPVHLGVSTWPDVGLSIPVCASTPCLLYVPPGEVVLQASGDRIDPCPMEVSVPAGGGRVTLRPASAALKRSGVALIGASIPLTILGAVLAGVGSTLDHEPSLSGTKVTYQDYSAPIEGVGGAIVGVGVGALISGIVLVATNRSRSEPVRPFDGAIHF